MDARQLQSEDILVPLFKRLRHYGVIGIGDGADGYIPRLFPRQEILIHEYAHKLGNDKRRVGVVDVYCHLIRQSLDIPIDRHMVADNILYRS